MKPTALLVILSLALVLAACGRLGPRPGPAPQTPTAVPPASTTTSPPPIPDSAALATSTPLETSPSPAAAEPAAPYPLAETVDAVYAVALQPDAGPSSWKLDVYAPTQPGPWPVVVFAHGVGSRKEHYAMLARDIAQQGAVVFNIDWPTRYPTYAVQDNGRGLREVLESLACAVCFARARAAEFGGDPGHLILAGYSLGGAGAQVALVGDEVDPLWQEFAALRGGPLPQIDCEVSGVSAHVDGFVGVAGVYLGYAGKYGSAWLQSQDPQLWGTLFSSLGQNPDLKVRLIHGEGDGDIPFQDAADFAALLQEAGYDVQLIPFDGGHTVPLELTAQTILELTRD